MSEPRPSNVAASLMAPIKNFERRVGSSEKEIGAIFYYHAHDAGENSGGFVFFSCGFGHGLARLGEVAHV